MGILLSAYAIAAPAPVDFPDVIRYRAGAGARAAIVVDLNRDGKADLVTANAAANTVSIFAGVGNGTFLPDVRHATKGKTPFALAAGRFNADEYPDLATVDLGTAGVTVLMSDGKGGFAPQWLETGGAPVSIEAADVNGDGFDDLVVANSTANGIDVFVNQRGEGFGARLRVPAGASSPRGLVVRDLNRDGRPDIATANSRAGKVSVLLAQGPESYGAAKSYGTGAGPQSICAADFDRDGAPDLATANLDAGTISILRNHGDGSFAPARDLEVRGPLDIRAVDVNGDGAIDVVVSQPDRDSVAVVLNQGDGAFAAAFELPVGGNHPTTVAVADLDANGGIDLVTVNEGSNDVSILLHAVAVPRVDSFSPGPTTRVSQVNGRLDQNVSATFNTSLDQRSLNGHTVKVYGHQSGYHDAKAVYRADNHTVTLEPGPENTFRPGENVTVLFTGGVRSDKGIPVGRGVAHNFTIQPQKGTGQFVELERVRCDKIPGTLKAADLNNDGKVDIIALCREVDGIRVHLNLGNAKFDFHQHIFLPTGGFGPWDLVPADLNNDGLIDIAVVNTFSSNMAVFTNAGAGKFEGPLVVPCGAGPMGIAAGDLNGDGFMDLVAATKGFPEILVFLNKGTKSIAFSEPARYPVAPSPYSVSVRDMDSDGTPDLIMTNLESDRGTLLMNRGDGTFRPPEEFPLVLAKALVDDPIDVNADGRTDVVTVNTASDDISVLLNSGGNTFSSRNNIPVGLTPTDQVFGDFNSDGYVDIALTLDGGEVVIMMNKKDGTFEKASLVSVGRNPTSPVTADFNGDGTLDLVIANQYSRDISVLINLPVKPVEQAKQR